MDEWEKVLIDAMAEELFKEEFPWTWKNQPEALKDIYRDIVNTDFLLSHPDEGGVTYG